MENASNKTPQDYVIAGKQYSVKNLLTWFEQLKIKFYWKGKGINSKCYNKETGKCIIKCDKKYYRPLEVDTL